MLNCVEIILVFLSELGVDVNKVKVNRDIVKVSWNLRFLLFVFYVYVFNMFFILLWFCLDVIVGVWEW